MIPENYKGLCGLCPFKCGCYSARCLAYRFTGSLLGDDLTCAFIRKSSREINLFRKLTNEALLSLSKESDKHPIVVAFREFLDSI